MNKDKIEVNMNVYDIPIVVEALEKANKEIERLENENERYRIALNEMAIIISNAIEYLTDDGVCILNKGMKENEQLVWTWENYYGLLDILKGEDE